MSTLTGPYAIDRLVVPAEFLTPRSLDNVHAAPLGTVLAQSDGREQPAWVCLGYVSKQTPLGQGIYCGFLRAELRLATGDEVRAALKADHPFGASFRPGCMEAMDASLNLLMASAINNWTTDNRDASSPPILRRSKSDLVNSGNTAMQEHDSIMRRWDEITASQAAFILQSLNSTPAR